TERCGLPWWKVSNIANTLPATRQVDSPQATTSVVSGSARHSARTWSTTARMAGVRGFGGGRDSRGGFAGGGAFFAAGFAFFAAGFAFFAAGFRVAFGFAARAVAMAHGNLDRAPR